MTPEELATEYGRHIPRYRILYWQMHCWIESYCLEWTSAKEMRSILAEMDIEHFIAEKK